MSRRITIRAWATTLALPLLALTACGGGEPAALPDLEQLSPPPLDDAAVLVEDLPLEEIEEPGPVGAWETVLHDHVDEDGHLDLDGALEAFSLGIGPVPGVSVDVDDRTEITSATEAVAGVLAHWDELDEPQRAAIGELLSPGPAQTDPAQPDEAGGPGALIEPASMVIPAAHGRSVPTARRPGAAASAASAASAATQQTQGGLTAPGKGCYGQTLTDGDSPGTETHRRLVDEAADEISRRLGGAITMRAPIHIVIEQRVTVAATAYTWVNPVDCDSEQIAHCTIHLNPKAQRAAPRELEGIVAHEVMHCLTFQAIGTSAWDLPMWILEGIPAWVGEDVAAGTTTSERWWEKYLTAPGRSLTQRSYDAIGFWAHAAETGSDPWETIPSVLRAYDSAPAYRAAIAGDPEEFHASWPSGYARRDELGAAWDTSMPGITAHRPQIPTGRVAKGLTASVGAYANRLAHLELAADVVTISTDGYVRVSDGEVDVTIDDSETFCVRDGGCECPGGADGPDLLLGSEIHLALTGGQRGARVEVQGEPLECESEAVAAGTVDRCLVGSWVSTQLIQTDDVTGMAASDMGGGDGALLDIGRDGSLTIDYGPAEATESVVAGMKVGRSYDGRGTATIAADGGTFTVLSDDFGSSTTTRLAGPGFGSDPLPGTTGIGDGSYECDGDTVTLRSPYPLGESISEFVRR